MIVHIIRHGEAVDANPALPDPWRYLTNRGRQSVADVASRLSIQGEPCLIISSPLVRAVQTAQIVADHCNSVDSLEISELLLQEENLSGLLDLIRARGNAEHLALVGHEPQLGRLVARLLGQEHAMPLQKAECVVLEVNDAAPETGARRVASIIPA